MNPGAGRLRHSLDAYRVEEADNGRGGYTTAMVQFATGLRGEVIALPGREAQLNQVVQAIAYYQVTMRYRTDLDGVTKVQLRYGAIDLNVRSSADPDGRRRWLVILADTAGTLPLPA